MAAKQRLTKGRIKARQRKMHQIAKLLELPGNIGKHNFIAHPIQNYKSEEVLQASLVYLMLFFVKNNLIGLKKENLKNEP